MEWPITCGLSDQLQMQAVFGSCLNLKCVINTDSKTIDDQHQHSIKEIKTYTHTHTQDNSLSIRPCSAQASVLRAPTHQTVKHIPAILTEQKTLK